MFRRCEKEEVRGMCVARRRGRSQRYSTSARGKREDDVSEAGETFVSDAIVRSSGYRSSAQKTE